MDKATRLTARLMSTFGSRREDLENPGDVMSALIDMIDAQRISRSSALKERDAALGRVADLEVRLHGPGPLKFIADDGDGERLEFDTLAEAQSCVDEWIHVQYREARLTGEWSDVTEHIRIFAEIERAIGVDIGEGVDFERLPTPAESKEGGA